MRIGYGRVSTRDQNPDAQQDALTAVGCEQIFIDRASGKLARRPELDKALLGRGEPRHGVPFASLVLEQHEVVGLVLVHPDDPGHGSVIEPVGLGQGRLQQA